ESMLPVDPSAEAAPGYDESQRGKANGFVGDGDVMDTWATSSLTPLIVTAWADDDDLFARTYPMDMRPQAYEIIRTWLFSTVVRSHYETGSLPWKNAAISGWVLDPDRKKMSKSKGNVVGPMDWIDKYGADALRYWAASARPGTDTAFEEAQLKIGRKLAIKVLNVSKFVLNVASPSGREAQASGGGVAGEGAASVPARVTDPLDRAMLAQLADVVREATTAFDAFDYARSLERTEAFFWRFCDDYVELVKTRAYQTGTDAGASATAALLVALATLQRLFAPILPYASEEVWSWWRDGSVHRESWPEPAELGDAAVSGDPLVLDVAADVLGEVRKAKSEAKVSLATTAKRVVVRDTEARLAALALAESDVVAAGKITELVTEAADELSVTVALDGAG
ncbi:MAG TPA: class I tRNA ligase family protein, partial [Acidimicrobiia bacterium]